MHHPREHDAHRTPADDGIEEGVLPGEAIAALAEHELVALFIERVGEGLDGLEEHRTRDGGYHRGHEPAL
jgi:hypothetical protein